MILEFVNILLARKLSGNYTCPYQIFEIKNRSLIRQMLSASFVAFNNDKPR